MANSGYRIILDLDTGLKERLESVVAQEGMSVEQLCIQVLSGGLTSDEEKRVVKTASHSVTNLPVSMSP